MAELKYLSAYPAHIQDQVQALIDEDRLADRLRARYPERHTLRSDAALYDFAIELKNRYLRTAPPLSKVAYDSSLGLVARALGTQTTLSRVQGARLKSKREIRIATLFRDCAPEFLRMIVVHELAHLKVREHDKSFYALCEHMEPRYHQYEFDLRLHLTWLDLAGRSA